MTNVSEWKLSIRYREILVTLILIPTGYTFLHDPFLEGAFFSNIKSSMWQIFIQFAVSACLFGYGILRDKFRKWVFWAGVSAIPTGLALVFYRVSWIAEYSKVSIEGDFLQLIAASGLVPVISIIGIVVYFLASKTVHIESNKLVERFSAIAGLIFTLLMLWGQYLPWDRAVYSSTSADWKFKGSGSQLLINECCFLKDSGWREGFSIAIPLLFLLAFTLLRVLGFHISNLGFLGILLWGCFETLSVLEGTGLQDPNLAGWSASDVSSYGLKFEVQIAFGGYLFACAFIGLSLVLLLPRAIKGRATSSSSQ